MLARRTRCPPLRPAVAPTLDAFARCWVQESVLLRVLAPAIASEKRSAYERLVAAWHDRRQTQFAEPWRRLAAAIAAAASDSVTLPEGAPQGHAARGATFAEQPGRRTTAIRTGWKRQLRSPPASKPACVQVASA